MFWITDWLIFWVKLNVNKVLAIERRYFLHFEVQKTDLRP
jgi:hypothetical protein